MSAERIGATLAAYSCDGVAKLYRPAAEFDNVASKLCSFCDPQLIPL
jgi:hypothetical protein